VFHIRRSFDHERAAEVFHERFPKSENRFSDKKRDKTKG